ncbi:MAG: hypothetical protein ABEN55_15540 [Bradymonadaceae bacterium]
MSDPGLYMRNPHGRRVHVAEERRDDLLEEGYELLDDTDEKPPPDADVPSPEETASSTAEGEASETEEPPLADEARAEIREALESDHYQTMRSTLAEHLDASTHGMGKSEVRDALESLLD